VSKYLSDEWAGVFDGTAIGTAAATFFGHLPDFAALLSVIWLLLRIWESKTVIKLIKRVRGKK